MQILRECALWSGLLLSSPVRRSLFRTARVSDVDEFVLSLCPQYVSYDEMVKLFVQWMRIVI